MGGGRHCVLLIFPRFFFFTFEQKSVAEDFGTFNLWPECNGGKRVPDSVASLFGIFVTSEGSDLYLISFFFS